MMTPPQTEKPTHSQESSLTRTERRQLRTRQKLVDAVRKLTAEKGVDALTVRDIAEEADIALGSLYNHFESKEAVLKEAVQEIIFQCGETIDAVNAASDDALEVIATAFITLGNLFRDDPILGWFTVRVNAYDPALFDPLAQRLVRDVGRGVASGQFNVPDVPMATRLIGACLFEFYRAQLQGKIADDAVPDFVHLMLRLLGAEEAAAKSTARAVWISVAGGSE